MMKTFLLVSVCALGIASANAKPMPGSVEVKFHQRILPLASRVPIRVCELPVIYLCRYEETGKQGTVIGFAHHNGEAILEPRYRYAARGYLISFVDCFVTVGDDNVYDILVIYAEHDFRIVEKYAYQRGKIRFVSSSVLGGKQEFTWSPVKDAEPDAGGNAR
jgi:hypothetical protein